MSTDGIDKKIPKHFSLNLSLSTAFILVVLLTSIFIGVATFLGLRSFVRDGIRDRLTDIVSLSVLQIDAVKHAKIQTRADEALPEYSEIKKTLRQIRDNSKDLRFVYTMRKNVKGEIIFVVDAEESEADVSHVGDVYNDLSPVLKEAFSGITRPIAEKTFVTDKWGTWLSCYAPMFSADGKLEGILSIDMSAVNVIAYERRFLTTIILVSLFASIIVALLGLYISSQISKPLIALETDMENIQQFELDSSLPVRSRITEIIKIKNAVDNMKNGLRSFKKYVPAKLVADLIRLQKEAVLGTEKKTITVMFSDIKDFTTISEKMPADILSQHLSQYFFGMTKTIVDNQGTVDKFIGDAIMSFWNAPNDVKDHTFLACRTALLCQKFLKEFALQQRAFNNPEFITRIGINTGDALVGNMGFAERMSYTATGDIVNLASRLEGLNKYYGTSILIGESVFERVHDKFVTRMIDVVAVKGRHNGTRIYELLAEKDAADPALIALTKKCNTAMAFYLNRQWIEAINHLKECVTIESVAASCAVILDRCRKYEKDPPPADWDGTWFAEEK